MKNSLGSPSRLLYLCCLAFFGLHLALAPAAAQEPTHYAAMLTDGTLLQGNSFTDWNAWPADPKLDGRQLFAGDNALLWIEDRWLNRQRSPQPFLELAQGDVLMGEAIEWRPAGGSPYDSGEASLVVRSAELLGPREENLQHEIRVLPRYVRRIVFEQRPNTQYQPGTLFYRDGRQVQFRSWRPSDQGVAVLGDDGVHEVKFTEIAELHLPESDFWKTYCDEVAALLPGGEGRLLTLHTTGGLVATSSLDRLHVGPGGNPGDPNTWIHVVQPIWSLDPLWIRGSTIWLRQSYLPTQMPLSRLQPKEQEEHTPLGGATWPWHRNENVLGGVFRSGNTPYGSGFGVHAPSRLQFELPATAQSLRLSAGIDSASSGGGCARLRVLADGRLLFESPILTGESEPIAIGPLDLASVPAAGGKKTIVLDADAVLADRPAGADPLDIRDHVDWLDPVIELDAEALNQAVLARRLQLVPVFDEWQVNVTDPAQLQLGQTWLEPIDAASGGMFRYTVQTTETPLKLHQEIQIPHGDSWLLIAAHTAPVAPGAAKLEIRAGGVPLATFDVPSYDAARQNPAGILLPLTPLAGLTVPLEIVPSASSPDAPVPPIVWHNIRVIDQLPTLYRLLEDDPRLLATAAGSATELVPEPVYRGQAALKIPAGDGEVRLELPRPVAIAAAPKWGEFRYLRFVLRKPGGRVGIELEHADSAERPVAYDAGTGDPVTAEAQRIWTLELPDDWIVITRDLYSDFGEIELNALVIRVPDGEYALLDHIYLARGENDFGTLPAEPSPQMTAAAEILQTATPALAQSLAATAQLNLPDGKQIMGLTVDPAGYVVTNGAAGRAVGQQAEARFRDGTPATAVVHGLDREHNLALWKLEGAGPWLAASLAATAPSVGDPLVALSLPGGGAPQQPLVIGSVHLATIDDESLTSDADPPNLVPGGIMLNSAGEVVAVTRRHTPQGTLTYLRASLLAAQLERLRQGGAYGTWNAQSAPLLGLTADQGEGFPRVSGVAPDTPAAAVGLQAGDLIQKFDGQPLATPQEFEQLLMQRDAGQTISLEIKRGEEILTLTPTLAPTSL